MVAVLREWWRSHHLEVVLYPLLVNLITRAFAQFAEAHDSSLKKRP
jgi:hypothetical protein